MKSILLFTIVLVMAMGCSSSDSSPANVVASDFVSDVNPKTIKQTQVFADHPENNMTETSTLIYENGKVKEIDFQDTDGTSGVIKVMHDEIGNISKTETYFNTSGTLTESSYLNYVYSKGLLTSMKKYYWYNNAFINLENTNFTYNAKNQMTGMKVTDSSGKTEREYTYEYSDDSTNPSKVNATIATANFTFTNAYAYENTNSPLIIYFQIRGFIDQALIKKNINKITGIVTTGPNSQDRTFVYTYNDNHLPTKFVQTDSNGSETWEFEY